MKAKWWQRVQLYFDREGRVSPQSFEHAAGLTVRLTRSWVHVCYSHGPRYTFRAKDVFSIDCKAEVKP